MVISNHLRIVAAGRGRTMSSPVMVETVLDLCLTKKEKPRLVYLGTATYDAEEPMQAQCHGYESSCDIIQLRVSEAMESIPEEREVNECIASADIVMVSGGNTLYAVNRWKELGIDVLLTQAAEQGVVMCGGSAGAICWFEEGHSDSMDPTTFLRVDPNLTDEEKKNWDYIRVPGLGFLPGLCVPHHDTTQSNGVPRSQDSERMMKEKLGQVCVGIDEEAALVAMDGHVKVVSTNETSKCCVKVCVQKNGGYKIISKDIKTVEGAQPFQDFQTVLN